MIYQHYIVMALIFGAAIGAVIEVCVLVYKAWLADSRNAAIVVQATGDASPVHSQAVAAKAEEEGNPF